MLYEVITFDSDLCGYARNCIPQPGGTALDTLSDRLMYRLQYRNFGSGRIWELLPDDADRLALNELLDTSFSIASFGQGADGEIYVLDIASGELHRLAQGSDTSADPRITSYNVCYTKLLRSRLRPR